jgi:3-deoxy-manno-octulosonate cytidylyltransferase (CMP-KDO synthetase)
MILAVIPARYSSSRFPGKPLAVIAGKTMIQRVWERTKAAEGVDRVVVATDDTRIAEAVVQFGGEVCMTGLHHQTGTERCIEVAQHYPDAELLINVQGDEPFIHPDTIAQLAAAPDYEIGTLVRPLTDPADLFNPNVVKVVFSQTGQALYFSRHPIPFVRGAEPEQWLQKANYFQHIGLYAFKRSVLERITHLEASLLEQAESLEQLRWLDQGFRIRVFVTEHSSMGVDTPEDLDKATSRALRHGYSPIDSMKPNDSVGNQYFKK